MRQLRAGEGEEHEHHDEPQQQEHIERIGFARAPQRRRQQGGERQHDQRQPHQVVPGLAAVALQRVLVAVEVMVEQEVTEELAVILLVQRVSPGQHHRREHQPAERIQHRLEPLQRPPLPGEINQAHQQRQRHRHRALGQEAQAHPQVDAQHFAQAWFDAVPVDVQHGQRDQHVEQRIGDGGMADHPGHQSQPQAAGGKQGGAALAGEAPGEAVHGEQPGAGAQRRGQAEGELAEAESPHRGGLQPIDQDRLVVARLAVKRGGEVVAAVDHLDGGLAESALIEVEQRHRAELAPETQQQRREQERDVPCGQAFRLNHCATQPRRIGKPRGFGAPRAPAASPGRRPAFRGRWSAALPGVDRKCA